MHNEEKMPDSQNLLTKAITYSLSPFFIGIGLYFSDIDQRLPFWLLGHRSFITHSLILPAIAVVLFFHSGNNSRTDGVFNPLLSFFLACFVFGLSLHLIADCWPENWDKTFSHVRWPFGLPYWGVAVSYGFLIVNGAAAIGWSEWLLRSESWTQTLIRAVIFATVLVSYAWGGEKKPSLIIVMGALWIIAFLCARGVVPFFSRRYSWLGSRSKAPASLQVASAEQQPVVSQ
ncbi:hypothetical protein JMJ55_23560 [Belnapia sp. T6]|uniref:Metal-dependent hydrolase n=1 Tax=Belnapia mucosa TaxID=2804532 RepID=A0ABS1V9G3_9PROT|nr:hypothetical protein [Belnapia mucosa]MBL6458321.1 hypothetical protein [Belnapia mucosa]